MKSKILWSLFILIIMLMICFFVYIFVPLEEKKTSIGPIIQEDGEYISKIGEIRELQQKMELDLAIKEATQFLNLHRSATPDQYNIEMQIRLAECYQMKGDLNSAEKTITELLDLAGDNPWVLIAAARIYIRKFEWEKDKGASNKYLTSAQTYLEKSLKFDPGQPYAYSLMAEAYFYQGNKDKAANAIAKALKIKPGDPEFKDIAGRIRAMP